MFKQPSGPGRQPPHLALLPDGQAPGPYYHRHPQLQQEHYGAGVERELYTIHPGRGQPLAHGPAAGKVVLPGAEHLGQEGGHLEDHRQPDHLLEDSGGWRGDEHRCLGCEFRLHQFKT